MNEDYSPSKTFFRVLHFWWALALLMVAGGVLGVVVSHIHKPVYESKAVITSILDYSLVGQIDDTDSDQIFVTIGQVIGSSAVENEVLAKVKADQLAISDEDILNNLSLDRQDNRWVLHVRSTNPLYAQRINQYWSTSAINALEAMKSKAVVGYMSQQYINSLATCLQQSVVSESASSVCTGQSFLAIQNEINKVVSDPNSELDSASLLILHTSFALTNVPDLPMKPVLMGQNISALVGMLIALLIGLVVISFDFPKHKNSTEATL